MIDCAISSRLGCSGVTSDAGASGVAEAALSSCIVSSFTWSMFSRDSLEPAVRILCPRAGSSAIEYPRLVGNNACEVLGAVRSRFAPWMDTAARSQSGFEAGLMDRASRGGAVMGELVGEGGKPSSALAQEDDPAAPVVGAAANRLGACTP